MFGTVKGMEMSAIDKAVTLLEILAASKEEMSIRELEKQSNISKSTIHRVLQIYSSAAGSLRIRRPNVITSGCGFCFYITPIRSTAIFWTWRGR